MPTAPKPIYPIPTEKDLRLLLKKVGFPRVRMMEVGELGHYTYREVYAPRKKEFIYLGLYYPIDKTFFPHPNLNKELK